MDLSKLSDAELIKLKNQYSEEKTQWHLRQNAVKVQLNSLYGASGNIYFRLYDLRMSEAITKSGQLLTQGVIRDMNDYINRILKTDDIDYCIASDTDSAMFNMGPFVKKALPNGANKEGITKALAHLFDNDAQKVIDDSFDEFSRIMNCSEPEALDMKREVISDKSFFLKKKNYVMRMLDKEGVTYAGGKIKAMGVASAKFSNPKVCRDWMNDMYPQVMDGNQKEYINSIMDKKGQFPNSKLTDIASSVTVSDVDTYEFGFEKDKKGMPIGSRAAVVHNTFLKKNNLTGKYERIQNGDKIYHAYLIMPNPYNSNVIGWKGEPPEELELDKYIDWDTMFDKTFKSKMDEFAKLKGWNTKSGGTLEGW